MPEYKKLPTSVKFRQDVGDEGDQPLLIRIMRLLDKYRAARQAKNDDRRLRCLVELYFCTNAWLRDFSRSKRQARRTPHLEALFRATVERLASMLDCPTLNVLPFKLEEYFGQRIDPEKWEADIGKRTDLGADEEQRPEHRDIATSDASFLSRNQLAMHRLTFKGGRIHMFDWFRGTKSLKLIRASTRDAGSPNVITPGFAGYAMRMDREIYITRHFEQHQGQKVAHSTYTAGQAVLCAGEIALADGKLLCVTTASGHYKPTPEKLLHVLEHFRTHGVELRDAYVGTKSQGEDGQYRDKYFPARDFLHMRGREGSRLKPLTPREEQAFFRQIPGYVQGLAKQWGLSEEDVLHQFSY